MSSQIDNVLIQVRSRLQENGIKLWLEPYYVEGVGPVESQLENLASEFCKNIGISYDYCLAAINELQGAALDKLAARKEFQTTGIATVKVRTVQEKGSVKILTINIRLSDIGSDLYNMVAKQINTSPMNIKLICAGKIVKQTVILSEQGITNNNQLMAIVFASESSTSDNNEAMYDRVRKAREDAELMLKAKNQSFLRMEDQDGNAVHLPPNEKKAILLALALHEKGRAVMKQEKYNEALILFLEADEEFSSCKSEILNGVDNYALLNLDIIWCYLCLKSVTHLPDAQRRLYICEQNFRKTYGENMDRVKALKGSSQNEEAIIMRLHLLQGVLLFHQNRRNEAKGLLSLAESELRRLKVDESNVLLLTEMGYSAIDARVALRSSAGDIDQAVAFIINKKDKKREARKRAQEENSLDTQLANNKSKDSWVNPRSLHTIINMGFQKEVAIVALRKSKNDLNSAIDLLQNNYAELMNEASKEIVTDNNVIEQIVKIGFEPEMAKLALEMAVNNTEEAIEILLKLQKEGNYDELFNTLANKQGTVCSDDSTKPSTSQACTSQNKTENSLKTAIKNNIQTEIQAKEAYERFAEDVSPEDDEYLNLPLIKEEQILLEYKRFLGQ